ncbi:MAG: hypothetical protein V3R34_02890 [Hyphomicrobium sp.]
MATDSLTKTQWRDRALRAKNRATAVAKATAEQADRITGFGVALGAAAGMGYYMAKSQDADGKWWGMDKEIWVSGGLFLVSLMLGARKDRASQMSAHLFLQAATGVGSAYAYGIAHQKAGGGNPDFS